jgi:SNF2-related domain/Bacterial SNF2 helicase associated
VGGSGGLRHGRLLLSEARNLPHIGVVSVQLTEALLSNAAGWEVMKRARAYLEQGQVVSSYWAPPLLRGVVQGGEASFRASMVINGPIDIENLCTCREAREWGKICAHSVAVGLHYLNAQKGEQSVVVAANVAASTHSRGPTPPRAVSGLRIEDGGEPAELAILFPPNLEQAVARGKVMLVFEAKWAGGRCPLNALPKGRAYAFSEKDKAIIEQVESLTRGETPAVLQLSVEEVSNLLPFMSGHEGLSVGRSKEVTVERSPMALPLQATLESNGEITLRLKGNAGTFTRVGNWVWRDYRLKPLTPALASISNGAVRIPRRQVPQFLNQQWPQLESSGQVEANFKLDDFTLEPQPPQFHLELKGGLAQLSGLLQCSYGTRVMTLGVTGADEGVWLPDAENITRYSTRDFAAEQAALGRLQRSGFIGPDSNGRLMLAGQNAVLNFFAREFAKLQRDWKVSLEEKLERSTAEKLERIQPQFHISSGVQWFDLGVLFASSSGETFPPAEIQRLLRSGQSHTRLKNGKVAVIDTGAVEELQEVLLDASPQQHEGGYRMNNAQAGFVESTLRGNPQWKVTAPTAWRERSARLSGETKLECPRLGDLESVLRSYQKDGVAWLGFLRGNGFGGILADEMGLGKTLQTLAFVSTLPRPAGTSKKPHLVVCPTSLVFNWIAEAKKFTPALKVLALHGAERHAQFGSLTENDLVVTSYALIRRDMERYRGIEFDTVVLDEAQHIKNRQTQNAQAVKSIRSAHRLVLTGTPLENSVLDL